MYIVNKRIGRPGSLPEQDREQSQQSQSADQGGKPRRQRRPHVAVMRPQFLHVAPVLVPLAAVGLILVMLGAAVVHARRHELPNVAVTIVLLILAAVVAWGRFGPYALDA